MNRNPFYYQQNRPPEQLEYHLSDDKSITGNIVNEFLQLLSLGYPPKIAFERVSKGELRWPTNLRIIIGEL